MMDFGCCDGEEEKKKLEGSGGVLFTGEAARTVPGPYVTQLRHVTGDCDVQGL